MENIINFSGFINENRFIYFEIINFKRFLDVYEIKFITIKNNEYNNFIQLIIDIEDNFDHIIKQVLNNHNKKDVFIFKMQNEKFQYFEYDPMLIKDYNINALLDQLEYEDLDFSLDYPTTITIEIIRSSDPI